MENVSQASLENRPNHVVVGWVTTEVNEAIQAVCLDVGPVLKPPISITTLKNFFVVSYYKLKTNVKIYNYYLVVVFFLNVKAVGRTNFLLVAVSKVFY